MRFVIGFPNNISFLTINAKQLCNTKFVSQLNINLIITKNILLLDIKQLSFRHTTIIYALLLSYHFEEKDEYATLTTVEG